MLTFIEKYISKQKSKAIEKLKNGDQNAQKVIDECNEILKLVEYIRKSPHGFDMLQFVMWHPLFVTTFMLLISGAYFVTQIRWQ